ncbi:hexose transporter, putative [Plasmodium knowlesi strain H]|uniref:Hexose transporter 1 n=3 Tax=Plasmodium knowlesi TaxID=5850 RepID=HXT1_PLAKN|nr:hexose transporter, putative [Plasmodium knowlesi strain H]OTN66844.1 putative Hexose transporter [Plasmodium knowlesi]CAA9986802.1 hexose transporter, putative [Plasmodium knowlesi strain H]CAD32939.1 hexose transporter [Plasmodium knowlesi]SBO23650.1 hexose transporter, putative [Plasmodium knowlesi strain H]SBO25220.1 hexose transporter, putative [Plasmodium knowlesi strain H]|eukprot:XP_002257986.1 monosaccharide transporter, putative [Plasmodium knowlesi strain H]
MKNSNEISSSQSLKNNGSDGFFNTSLMYVLAACLASFLFGYQVSVLNTIKDFIVIEFGWCAGKEVNCDDSTLKSSFLLASVFIGAVVGSGFSGFLVQHGRRFSLLVIYNFFILVSILTSITHHFHTILFSRLLSGFGIGLITVSVPMYISEMTHKDKKGAYGVLHQLFITFGIFIAVLLGMAMGNVPEEVNNPLGTFQQIWWRLMFFFPCIISILGIVLLTFFFKEETPYYLFEKGKVEESKEILKKIYGSDDVDEPLKAIKDAVEQNEAAKKNSISLMRAMKIPSYRYVILLGCILSGLQQFTGINVLVSNSNALYKGFLTNEWITTLSVIMTVVNFLMTFPAIYIVEKLGRKTLLLCGCAGIVCAFLPTAIANLINNTSDVVKKLSISATFVMIVSFAVSYGPVLWIYLHEMFPSEIKDSAASLASLVNWMCAIIVVFPSDIIIKQSPTILFFIFSGMSIVAFLFIFFFIKETKGGEIGTSPYITLEERQKHMGKSVV